MKKRYLRRIAAPLALILALALSLQCFTPTVQFGYSFYLNHINSDTKNIIRGTTIGAQMEWSSHNAVYYTASIINNACNAIGTIPPSSIDQIISATVRTNLGATVFDNGTGSAGIGMMAINFYGSPVATLIDFFVWEKNNSQKENQS